MKLINVSDNFSVESFKLGNKTVEFVHDKNTGYNYFNQKVLCDLFGINQNTVSKHLNKYLADSPIFTTNSSKIRIRLQTSNKGRKTAFYGFDAVTYLAYRINNMKAFKVRETISDILNTMFNVATGKDSINSNKDWLKNQCELKTFQAATCKKSSDDLYSCGLEHVADKTWSEYKKLNAEALKYKELYLDYDRIDKIVASERNTSTKQLKLI